MRTPPSLVSLAIDAALINNLSNFSDLSPIPEHILLDLFLRTLRAGKLTERILNLFIATGKEEVLSLIESLNIQHVLTPVLPTKSIMDNEVDIVIGALHSDLTSFMEEWRLIFSRYHLIIVKDPDLKEELKIPGGFNLDVYSKSDIDRTVGSSSATLLFSGYSCRYFGYLMSRKKYIISVDDDCSPARDNNGDLVDIVAQHITNLSTPATPFFFNTLYDPYRKGADFVRGYPFSLRNGVPCTLSCGLWLNLADYDAPTQALKPELRNSRYVDAVLTVPARSMMPLSGINIGFDRELVGPALLPALMLAGEGKFRWETVEDIWCGMCVKVVSDHMGLGVKTGLPYVWRKERGDVVESLKKDWKGVKLMEEVVPFFQSLKLSPDAISAEDCVVEMAAAVKERLGPVDPVFGRAANAMVDWIKLWKVAGAQSSLSVA
ncbi:probable UDP-arabinopyranose mutase 5 isoform X2 [Rhododendron vialii]|uniref:probable UDP-arabinopyranose mutase 5 isoform X2 n=1 Tax=Rhododendron vialii TaxID=182163 RepID=UPI0026601B60|nr:probable UDP-arabinopyranose mutase 5 isoform X2 [Rhododendron vialii]